MKKIFTLLAMALAMTSARASVVINSTNFPDDNLRYWLLTAYDDGDGVLSDEELANNWLFGAENVNNTKGLELLTGLKSLGLTGVDATITTINAAYLPPNLEDITIYWYDHLTSLDLSSLKKLTTVKVNQLPSLSSLKCPVGMEGIHIYVCPKLTSFDFNQYKNLGNVQVTGRGLTDIVIKDLPNLFGVLVEGFEEEHWTLGQVSVTGCPNMNNFAMRYTKVKNVTFSDFLTENIGFDNNEIDSLIISNGSQLSTIEAPDNIIRHLTLRKLPVLNGINCDNDQQQTLIVDECPEPSVIRAKDNQLMWLYLGNVRHKDEMENGHIFVVDKQQPRVQAVKISPTEVGLRVHPRMNISKVQDLTAKGLPMEPKEIFVDGIRYFVIYNNGPDVASLVGAEGNYYRYNTDWPYPWYDNGENTADNLLPVTMRVTSWTKHQAFLTLSTSRVVGKYGEPAPAAPTVTRSQDYDGKITFASSNEQVVKVDPDTGVLTVIGAGTATIYVKGEETDYRLAPVTKTYTVFIEKATPVIAFPAAEINATYGETVPLNSLTVTWYEGIVSYASANETKATVDAATGVVTTKGAGDVVIKGIAPETSNFYRREVTYTLHIAKASPVFAFEKNGLTVALGAAVPENKLNVGLYDGEVQYTSSDETIATVDAQGVVTTLAIGEVTITATGAETENCNEAKKADYKLTIADPSGISSVMADAVKAGVAYDLIGRKVNIRTVDKGVYIMEGKKVVKK